MKRPEYVAVVTRSIAKPWTAFWKPGNINRKKQQHRSWSRYSTAALPRAITMGLIIKLSIPKKNPITGEFFLGRVQKLDKGLVDSLEDDLEAGDGIEFWTQKMEIKAR